MDYMLLDEAIADLPPIYSERKELLRWMLGEDPRALRSHVYDFLLATGFSKQAFSKPGLEFLRYES